MVNESELLKEYREIEERINRINYQYDQSKLRAELNIAEGIFHIAKNHIELLEEFGESKIALIKRKYELEDKIDKLQQ